MTESFSNREEECKLINVDGMKKKNTNYHFEAYNKTMIQARIINYY